MIGSFVFNDIESSTFKLVCKSVKRPLLPSVKMRRVEPSGLSGVYDFDDDVDYDLRQLAMQIAYIGTSFEELRTRAREIAAWLSAPTWTRLRIHDEDDKYYLAKVTDAVDFETMLELGSAEIPFDCQPFAYSQSEETVSFSAEAYHAEEFVNPGTRLINYRSPIGSKFNIEITGSWASLTVVMNGKSLTYPIEGSGTLIINNVDMEVTLNGQNVFGNLIGNTDTFLKIVPDTNALALDGVSLDVSVAVKFIPLWM